MPEAGLELGSWEAGSCRGAREGLCLAGMAGRAGARTGQGCRGSRWRTPAPSLELGSLALWGQQPFVLVQGIEPPQALPLRALSVLMVAPSQTNREM